MAEKKVSVRLVAENGRQVRAELEGTGDAGAASFKRLSKEVDTSGVMLKRLAGIAAGAVSIRQIQKYTDTWTDLRSRVDLATGSQERGAAVMDRLADMARRTYSSLENTTESWLSNSRALRDLGMTTAESLDFTEALNNALVVSGARAERAASVQNALSRAMAAGKLSGDQLNTVIETGGRVADMLAEELGTTVSGLRTMGQQGLVTGDVIRTALVGNLELLREQADSMPATIGDAFTLIGNAALTLVGKFDQLVGASSTVADALILVADNLDHLAVIAMSFATFMAGRWVVAFVAARIATFSLAAALTTLRVALINTGIGAVIVLAGELAYWLGRVVVASDGVGAAFLRVFNVGKETFLGVGRTAWGLLEILGGIASGIAASFVRAFAEIARAWDGMINGMAAAWNAVATSSFGETLGLAEMQESNVSGVMRGFADNLFAGAEESIRRGGKRIVDAGRSVRDAFEGAIAPNADGEADALDDAADAAERIGAALDKVGKGGGSGAKKTKEETDATDQLIKSLERELAVLNETDPIKRKMIEHADTMSAATERQRARVVELLAALEDQKSGFAAIGRSLAEYAEKARNVGGDIGNALVGAFTSAENAFAEFVTTGKLNFRDLVTSILADMAKLTARQYILGPLAGLMSGSLGGTGGGGLLASIFHDGGVVGGPAPGRMMPAMALLNAPRMHSGGWAGLRSDEVPAILQRGERVLSRREAAGYGRDQGGVVRVVATHDPGILMQVIDERAGGAVQAGLESYDRNVLPHSVRAQLRDPRRVG